MSKVQETIEIDVPVHVAYDQWTQFADFPRFMDGVERVDQLDDTRLHWVANVNGKTREWDAIITEQKPDSHIAWQGEGTAPSGAVSFQPAGEDRTRLTLVMDYEPEGAVERVGDAIGTVQRQVKSDLQRFKGFIETRGRPTGAWRGEVKAGRTS